MEGYVKTFGGYGGHGVEPCWLHIFYTILTISSQWRVSTWQPLIGSSMPHVINWLNHLPTSSWIVACLVNFQLGATCHRCSGDTCHLFIFPFSFTFDFFPSLTGTLTTYKFCIRTLFEVKFSPLEIYHQALHNYGIFRAILIIWILSISKPF